MLSTLLMTACLVSADPTYELVTNTKLAALSTSYHGKPFGSLVAYAVDDEGSPILFISDLAIHTKNLNRDESCSIMISEADADDVFNSKRITLLGKMKKIERDKAKDLQKIYLAKYEDAKDLLEMEDFNFYKMEVEKAYWVGGFGDIEWLKLTYYQKLFEKD